MTNENSLVWRRAASEDVPLLARINRELIEHEWGGVSKSLEHLEARLQRWISDPTYTALVFSRGEKFVAYTLLHLYPDEAYIRHFYVSPQARSAGMGRQVCEIVLREFVPPGVRVSLDVLTSNQSGLRFWRSIGFRDYSVVMELYNGRPAAVEAA